MGEIGMPKVILKLKEPIFENIRIYYILMKAIIFNGALERKPLSTSGALSDYISGRLKESDVESKIFNLAKQRNTIV